jgi:uncharacterized membrane protein SpoIIM required for sporulation
LLKPLLSLIRSRKNPSAARKSLAFYQGDSSDTDRRLADYEFESNADGGMDAADAKLSDLFFVAYLRRAMLLTFMVLTLCLPFYPILQCSTTFLRLINIDE